MADRVRVAFLQELPTPYRWPLLRRIGREPSIELTVLFYAATEADRSWGVVPESEEGGVRVEVLPGRTLRFRGRRSLFFHWNPGIARRLAEGRFDVVVLPGWSMPTTLRAWRWCRSTGTPYLLFSETHALRRRPAWLRTAKGPLLRAVVGGAAAWLATGTLSREYLVAHGAAAERVFRFANTPDVAALAAAVEAARAQRSDVRRRLDTPDDATVVVSVGRLLPVKDPATLVEAVARLESRGAGAPHLWFVGEGPLSESLRADVEARSLRGVRFTGALRPDELPPYWAAADAFALASRHEPWGVVVNEAMAAGLPLVLSDAVGAAADLLEDRGNGFLVPAGDAEGFARAFGELYANEGLRRSMGERSRALVASWDHDASVRGFLGAVAAARASRGARA